QHGASLPLGHLALRERRSRPSANRRRQPGVPPRRPLGSEPSRCDPTSPRRRSPLPRRRQSHPPCPPENPGSQAVLVNSNTLVLVGAYSSTRSLPLTAASLTVTFTDLRTPS